jgi:hypothetical protein
MLYRLDKNAMDRALTRSGRQDGYGEALTIILRQTPGGTVAPAPLTRDFMAEAAADRNRPAHVSVGHHAEALARAEHAREVDNAAAVIERLVERLLTSRAYTSTPYATQR